MVSEAMPRKRLPAIGDTFTTPISKRVFTCVAHVEHVRVDGRTVLVPLWRIRCVVCGDPFDRRIYRPKMVRCRPCLEGYSPGTAKDAAMEERHRRHLRERAAAAMAQKPPLSRKVEATKQPTKRIFTD